MRVFHVDETPALRLDAEVPLDNRLATSEDLLERQYRLLEARKELSVGLSTLRERYRAEVREIIGAERWDAHREQHLDLVARIAATEARFERTPEGEEEERAYRESLSKEKHDLYHGAGFDTRRAVVTRKKYAREASRLFAASLEADAQVPEGADLEEPKPTSNPWTWVFPPYVHGWTHTVDSVGTTGRRSMDLGASPASGQISLQNSAGMIGTDGSDWCLNDVMAEVGFWFKMPAAGLVEAWIYYQDIDTDYTGELQDEAGCSDADIRQLSRVYLWTKGASERYSTVIDYRRGESRGRWARGGPTVPGGTLRRHLFSHDAYQADDWVWVAAGVRDTNYTWVDEMSCVSKMTSKWFVSQVAVRSTGGH